MREVTASSLGGYIFCLSYLFRESTRSISRRFDRMAPYVCRDAVFSFTSQFAFVLFPGQR